MESPLKVSPNLMPGSTFPKLLVLNNNDNNKWSPHILNVWSAFESVGFLVKQGNPGIYAQVPTSCSPPLENLRGVQGYCFVLQSVGKRSYKSSISPTGAYTWSCVLSGHDCHSFFSIAIVQTPVIKPQ